MENYEKAGYLKEPFRVFHLRDNVSGEMSLHYHDFDKIIVFWGGKVNYMIEGCYYELKPGDIVLVGHGQIHRPVIDNQVPYERSILYISTEYLRRYLTQEYDPSLCFARAASEKSYVLRLPEAVRAEAERTLLRLERCSAGKQYGYELEMQLLFLTFMLEINRIVEGGRGFREISPEAVFNQKIVEILNYIGEHLTGEISVDGLADRFYVSKYHLMRTFKKETGYTIHRYITEKRMILAKEKLLSGSPAVKVSEECGYSDYSTFLRAFSQNTGMTPSEFVTQRRPLLK
ncbi:MAG: AraC family transcriptional regulator [Lachnospiraceae bacterium]|nr:AraC family transcriptional regulator [Lachnospiraceae bacterium]MDD7147427.1 AraC family transcriptional regulator [Lachnospiraceae bacterium]MDY4070222.1 AraC family transcriptional regulator [Lachnospiraceae bacterium]